MAQNYKNFPAANAQYVSSFGDKGSLPLPPGKKVSKRLTALVVLLSLFPAYYRSVHEALAYVQKITHKGLTVTCMDARIK
jgi:hypothetical protein